MCSEDEKPTWWKKNEQYKQRLGIPEYRPPRFEDSVYTHTVVAELEEKYDCTIRFVGIDSNYPDDWQVRIDGEPTIEIGRHRDPNGNTVYELESEQFEAAVEKLLEDSTNTSHSNES